MKKVAAISLLFVLFLSVFVLASSDAEKYNSDLRKEYNQRILNANTLAERQRLAAEMQQRLIEDDETKNLKRYNIRERLEEGDKIEISKGLAVMKINSEVMELQSARARVATRLNISEDEINASRLRAMLSNGRFAEINIMPETASERAIERLRLRNCSEANNCTIELKEVGEGNNSRLVYEARAGKTFRIFGIFRNRAEVTTQIDAETGEEIRTGTPWWSFMASEEEANSE